EDRAGMEVVCGSASETLWGDLLFAWRACKHVTSNAIVLARELQTLGIGAGQMSRVDSVRIALEKAREHGHALENAVLASDAFFPFADVAAEPNPRRWLILAVVGTAFFMTILDVAIVNVAIPSIQTDLNITQQTVEWVIIAYSITFGGFLLLGGRIADLLGRRRIFL